MKKIYIYDFGSQYTQLIARRFRELGYYSEILPFNFEPPEDAVAFVLSGGPASVYEDGAPLPPLSVLKSGKPILGICYGLQVIGTFWVVKWHHPKGRSTDRLTWKF